MATIKKNSAGNYEARVYIGRDDSGKQIFKYLTRSGYKEIKAAVREIEEEIERGGLNNIPNMKFSSWSEKYLEIKKSKISSTTYLFYKNTIEKHFNPYFKFKLYNINSVHIQDYISKKLKILEPATVRKQFYILQDILGMALKRKNPCLDVDPPNGKSKPRYVPTEKEFGLLHESIKGLWDEIPILLGAWCGLREGEIFALKVNDIFEGSIRIDENRALTEDGTYDDKSPKSENGNRVIVVSEELMNLVKKHIEDNKLKDDDYLFPMRPDTYCKRFAKLVKYYNLLAEGLTISSANNDTLPKIIKPQKEKINSFTFHALRHYHATMLYRYNIPDKYAADRLGHDIIVLKKIYQRLQVEDRKGLDDKVKNIFGNSEVFVRDNLHHIN